MSLGLSTASSGFSVGFSSASESSASELVFSSATGLGFSSATETSTGKSFFVPAAFARAIGQTEGRNGLDFNSRASISVSRCCLEASPKLDTPKVGDG